MFTVLEGTKGDNLFLLMTSLLGFRTARGMEYGSALSFVCSGEEEEILKKAEEKLSGGKGTD